MWWSLKIKSDNEIGGHCSQQNISHMALSPVINLQNLNKQLL